MGNHQHRPPTRRLCLAALALVAGPVAGSPAGDEADAGLAFASGLIERGFPDFAEDVLEDVLAAHPERKEEALGIRAALLLAQRKFDEATPLVDRIPASTDAGRAIRIKLANAYYRAGNADQARSLYEQFFAQFESPPTDPGARAAYQEAALYLTAMLENAEAYGQAADSIQRIVDMGLDPETRRVYLGKLARLRLRQAEAAEGAARRKTLQQVEEIIRDIEFGGPFWVSHGVLLRADVARVRGDEQEALELLQDHRRTFKQIEASLHEAGAPLSQSPRAGYFYLRGTLLHAVGRRQAEGMASFDEPGGEEAKGALAQALNAFALVLKRYPQSDVATDAALGLKTVEDLLISKGAQVKRTAAIQAAAPAQPDELYRTADALFRRGEYAGAAEEYQRVLNQFPETAASPKALTRMAQAYARQGDALLSRMVLGYLAERFAGDPEAARGCLILATFYGKEDLEDLRLAAYEAFAAYFPHHPQAPQVLYAVALVRKRQDDEAASSALFRRLIDGYPRSPYALKSLMALAVDAYRAGRYHAARDAFDQYAAASPEGLDKAKARMLAADARLRDQEFADAFRAFRAVAEALDPADPHNPYYVEEEDRPDLIRIHQQAMFQQAYSLSQVPAPPETRQALRENAARLYDQFLAAYDASALAPKALAAKGGVLLQLDRMEEATTTFESLARAYPETPEGRSSLFTLVEAAIRVDKVEVARNAVAEMAANPAAYQPEMFALVGQRMLDGGLHAEAIQAYEALLQITQEPALLERAYYGLGQSRFAGGDCREAIRNFETLVELNERTGFLFDARLQMARAYRQCGEPVAAIEALRDIFALDRDPVRIQQANFELARIQESQERVEDAYASYLRMGLNPDPTRQPALMDIYRIATLKAAGYAMERGEWDTVILLADQFVKFWPDDEQAGPLQQKKRQALLEKAAAGPEETADSAT